MSLFDLMLEVSQRVMKRDPSIEKMFPQGKLSLDKRDVPIPDTLQPLEDEDDDVEIIIKEGQINQLYDAAVSLAQSRKGLYALFDEMEQDTLVSSALEMMVDDATQYSIDKEATIWPEEGKYQKDIEELFDTLGVEDRIWGWAYNVAKYGDFFLQVAGEEGTGIVRVIDDTHPSLVYRIEVSGRLSAFIVTLNRSKAYDDREQYVCEPYHFVHFISNYKPIFDSVTIVYYEKDKEGKSVENRKVITSTYGTSALYNVRQAFKNLKLMEKSLALARLARSPQVRVFYVNTEGMTPKERQDYVKKLKEKFKRKKSFDADSDFFDTRYNPLSYNDDLFIPITGSTGDVRTETLGGDVDVKSIVDVDYFRDKFFAGIRIPKAFMGFEEAAPGTNNTGLTMMDIRYARLVKKIQRSIMQGMQRLCQIHLAYKYKKPPILKQIRLGMTAISSVEESQRLDSIEKRFAIATTMAQLMRDLEGKVNSEIMVKYIFSHVLRLSGINLDKLFKVPKSQIPPEGGGFGMGAPGEENPPEETGEENPPEAGPTTEIPPEETEVPPEEAGTEFTSISSVATLREELSKGKVSVDTLMKVLEDVHSKFKNRKYITTDEIKSKDTEADLPH